jgi:integrase/recombinase XerD
MVLIRRPYYCRPSFRAATYETLIGLLACTGLRVGEAIRLDRHDVDYENGVLIVRTSKFGKSRVVAQHPSTISALQAYGCLRDQLHPSLVTSSFFVNMRASRLAYRTVNYTFVGLVKQAKIGPALANGHLRLHDLRHSFAVRTLLQWYRGGGDVQVKLPVLSTYLGHIDPKSTYWYLSAAPELLALASSRLEHALEVRP